MNSLFPWLEISCSYILLWNFSSHSIKFWMFLYGKDSNYLTPTYYFLVSPPVILWYLFYVPTMLKYPWFAKCNNFRSDIFRDILFPVPKELFLPSQLLSSFRTPPGDTCSRSPPRSLWGGKVLLSSLLPFVDTFDQGIFICLTSQMVNFLKAVTMLFCC